MTAEFGEQLKSRLLAFQRAHGLADNGAVSAETWQKLVAANDRGTGVATLGDADGLSVGAGLAASSSAASVVGNLGRAGWVVFTRTTPIRIVWTALSALDWYLDGKERERQRQRDLEELRTLGDPHRRWTLANVAAHVLEDFATSSAADAVIFTQDQGKEIQDLGEGLVTFFHGNDHRFEGEEVSTDGGWLATMPSTHWSTVESKALELFDAFTTSLKYGEPLRDQGPKLPERGPVLVKPEEVHHLFFGRTSHPQYLVPARDRPVSRAAE